MKINKPHYFLVLFLILLILFFSLASSFNEAIPGTPSAAAGTSPSAAVASTCSNWARCQEIDTVWRQIRGLLQLSGKAATNIWHNGNWQSFEVVYPEAVSPPSAISPPLSNVQYDGWFKQYGQQQGVSPALLKAISYYESGGLQPLAIGPAGDVGLFQFVKETAVSNGFPRVMECCDKTATETYSCSEENAKLGKVWTGQTVDGLQYKCNFGNDDRFNAEMNIQKGAEFVSKNYQALNQFTFASEEERIKMTIAAHHLGRSGIINCIKGKKFWESADKCRQDLSFSSITWNAVGQNFPEIVYKNGQTYRQVMDKYVQTIYGYYLSYKPVLGS